MKSVFFSALLAITAPAAAQADICFQADWCQPTEPFRIVGNVHYVGTAGLSAFLITDPKGHVLIDGGLPQSAPLIAVNIRKLGFRMKDVRYLLINHAHFDHAGGLAELKRVTGAKLVASRLDAPDLEPGRTIARPEQPAVSPVKVDRRIGDGDVVTLGKTRLAAILTPGHTPGATSWVMTTSEGGKPVRLIFASSLTVAGLKLPNHPGYAQAGADFRATFARLTKVRADVFLTFHPSKFDMDAKRQRKAKKPGRNPFIDPSELSRRVAAEEKAFKAELP